MYSDVTNYNNYCFSTILFTVSIITYQVILLFCIIMTKKGLAVSELKTRKTESVCHLIQQTITSIGKTSANRQMNHFVTIRAHGISRFFICCDTSGNFFLKIYTNIN